MRVAAFGACSWLLPVVLLAFLSLTVLADGIVIPQRAYAIPQIPDQSALIYYVDGTETLVIETSFAGQGTNFAWIVPLPAVARIEPVSAGLFPTLQSIFQPRIVLSVKHYWVALPLAVMLVWLAKVIRRLTAPAFVLLFCFVIFAILLLPALSTARSKAGASASTGANVQILGRQTVGLFDTATIKSDDPGAVANWLNRNGFAAPTNILPALAYYVHKGWVFAAARLICEPTASNLQATHPLAFTFNTREPVYPLRLTALGSKICRIDLYVFGPARAAAPGFRVVRCEKPTYDSAKPGMRFEGGQVRVRHKELAKLISGARVATKLSGVLNSSDMTHDAYLSWPEYQPSGAVRYTKGAALTIATNIAALSFVGFALIWWLCSRAGIIHQVSTQRTGPWLAPAALAIAAAVYFFWLPKIDSGSMRMTRVWRSKIQADALGLALALGDELGNTNLFPVGSKSGRPLTQTEAQTLLSTLQRDNEKVWAAYPPGQHPMTNMFTGERIRFEASPGNYTLRPTGQADLASKNLSGYELIWHDLDGAEALTNAVPDLR